MTRGRCGSLLHIRMTFAFTTPRRFNRRTGEEEMRTKSMAGVLIALLLTAGAAAASGQEVTQAEKDRALQYLETTKKNVLETTKGLSEVPVAMTFFMGSVMLLAAAGDIRMLVRGGVLGAKRIARHLWRMCFGLFIAAGSFFFVGANRPLRLLSTIGLGQHLPQAFFSIGL